MLGRMNDPQRGHDPAGDFAEIWDAERASSRHLRLVTAGLLLLLVTLSTGWCRSASRTLQPVFVRVDEIGRAEALDYEALTWQNDPLHPSTKYFLRQFVADHYARRFATVAERWPRSLAFLERTLAAAAADAQQQEIAEFASGLIREERAVENVSLRVLARPEEPHEATADFRPGAPRPGRAGAGPRALDGEHAVRLPGDRPARADGQPDRADDHLLRLRPGGLVGGLGRWSPGRWRPG